MLRSIVLLAAVSAYGSGLPHAAPKELSATAWSNIRAEYQRHRQAAFPVDGGYRARNYGQRWVTRFDGRGFDITPDTGIWRWGLELRSYGFPGQERTVKHARANAEVERLAYQWDPLVTEWFVNSDRGLEHGFAIGARPGQSAAALTLHLALRGTLKPRVSPDGRLVSFLDDHGAPALNYSGLKATDAQGAELTARFVREADGLRLEVEEQSAVYPITIDPLAQQAYLKPAAIGTTQAGDWFGYSVAVSGNTVVVGAPQEDSSSVGINSTPNELAAGSAGAAYVFTGSGGTWTQQAYLKPAAVGPGGQAGDHFGFSVAISGDTVVVGAIAEDSATTGVNSTPLEGATDSGAAYVFVRSGSTWTQQAYLKASAVGASNTGDEFGWSVAISGDTIAVGAYDEASSTTGINSSPNEGAPGAGAAFVFVRTGTSWSQQAYLKPAAVGTTQANDHFGVSIAVSGDTIVVGAFQEDSSSTGINSAPNELAGGAGATYVFFRSGGAWSQQAYLKPAAVGPSQSGDNFGTSVAISGDTIAVGANHEASSTMGINTTPNDLAGSSGAVYVFTRSGATWTQQAYVKPSAVGTSQGGDDFGVSVALSGDTLVVGADGEDSSTTGINGTPNESAALAGAAYVFTRSAGVWTQQAYLKPGAVGTTQAGDHFGWSVAVSGDTAVIGANLEDSSTVGVNGTPTEGSADSGAAYVFTVPGAGTTTVETKAVMTSPATGSTLTGSSVTFTWMPGTGATNYVLDVGTVAGGTDLFHQNVALATLQTVTGLPTDGSTIYVRLSTALSAGIQFNDYTYKASGSSGAGSKAVMVSPVSGSTLTGASVTFTWIAGSGATAYWLDVGTAQGQGNIFGQNVALVTSQTVSGIPTDASTVYVNLWTLVNGAWQYNAYTYKASGASAKAVMISPVPGSTLSGASVTFTWTSAAGAASYWLDVATAQGQGYIFGQGVDLATSQTVNGIPTNGSTIYVRVWTLLAGLWQSSDYTYKTASVNSKAVMLLPTPGTVLGGATVTFTWSAGSSATAYWLDVGSLQGQANLFDQNVGLATSQTVSGIPTNGSTVYVRLWTTFGGAWQLNDYTYKAASVNSAAVMLLPVAGTALGGSTVTFSWKPGVGAVFYWLLVGSYEGRGDIFGNTVGLATSKTVSGIPNDGSPVYVFLRTLLPDGFHDNEYIYKAPGGTRAVMTFPPPASQLNSTNVIFTWKPGNGATSYWLEVGTAFGASNLYSQVVGASTTSRTVTGVPTGGGTIYVRLWTAIQGQWQWNDYSYNAAP